MPQLAAAETQQSSKFNVFSGKPHRVDTYLAWTDQCTALTATAKQVRKPKHGAATFKSETTTIRSANSGSVHDCRGKKVKGLSVYYTSKPGFRGTDTFVVTDGTTVYTYRMRVH